MSKLSEQLFEVADSLATSEVWATLRIEEVAGEVADLEDLVHDIFTIDPEKVFGRPWVVQLSGREPTVRLFMALLLDLQESVR